MDSPFIQSIVDDHDLKHTIEGLRNSYSKWALTFILTVLSGGFILLLIYWYPHLNVLLTKKKTRLRKASHLYLCCKETGVDGVANLRESNSTFDYMYQYSKYIYDDGEFVLVCGLKNLKYSDIHSLSGGISEKETSYKAARYGKNLIDVPVPSYFKLFFKEVLKPFYIFQAFAVILWLTDAYELYASAIFIITMVSVWITIIEERKQNIKINKMAALSADVTVLRDGFERVVGSSELVPGDVILIPRGGMLLPCDSVLVSGTAIVNECALTGESVPVTKASVPYISKFIYESGDVEQVSVSEDLLYDPNKDKKYSLLSGTTVIQSKPSSRSQAVALVTRTGFSTFKGSLIRSIMCPKPTKFDFEADAARFMLILGFFASFGFCFTIYFVHKQGATFWKTMRLALDLITVVVPPALPAALSIGIVYAVQRLKKSRIYCIDPQRVNFCGKLEYICFDKTGTLTEDGLSVLFALPSASAFKLPIKSGSDMDQHDKFLHAMATCHEISIIDDKIIGDPLDIEMFKYTGWKLESCDENNPLAEFLSAVVTPGDTDVGHRNLNGDFDDTSFEFPEVGIIKSFPFTPELQRMSVVTKGLVDDEMIVYCKGSPEMILSLSKEKTIPFNFQSELDSYTQEGLRVIAFGWKSFGAGRNWHNIQTISRTEVESDLNFTGLLIMENHLKEDTTACITDLSFSNTKVCMITGDNILTAITVSKKCGIVPAIGGKHDVIVVKVVDKSVCLHLEGHEEASSILPLNYTQTQVVDIVSNLTRYSHVFAISGSAFAFISTHEPLMYELLLLRCKVFARMRPAQKQKLVEDLQGLGHTVSMCGDGANDCGALKAAHAGVSLSEAEASIAAPFTSANPSISCMTEILRQGRAALVTASVTFRFMATYSLIQFIGCLLLYRIGNNLSDAQFIYIDLVVITGIAATIGLSEPAADLAPSPPKSRLIDFKVFILLTLHILTIFGFQVYYISFSSQSTFSKTKFIID